MDIFKLVGSVYVDTDKANDSLSKVDKKAEDTGLSFGEMAGKVGSAAAVVGGAAVAAGAALVGMAKNAADSADEIDKGSLRMGVSTDYFQQLRYAAGQCGVEMSTMEKAAKKLEGTDMNFEDAINQIMSLGTETERSQMASELFGDSIAYQLSPILAGTGEEFSGLMNKANELGIVMSEDSVAAGVTLGDTMSDVQQSFGAVVTQIGAEVLPIVQQVLDWVLAHMPEIQAAISTACDVIGKVIEVLVKVFQWMSPIVSDIITAVGTTFNALKDTITNIWNNMLKPVVETIVSTVSTFWNNGLKPVIDAIGTTVSTIATGIVNTVSAAWNLFLKPYFDGIIGFFQGIFSGDIQGAFSSLVDAVGTIWGNIVNIVRGPVNSVIGVINGFINGIVGGINNAIGALNRLHVDVPDWVTAMTGVRTLGFNIGRISAPQIPMLAEGGDITQSGSAIVGEEGPELLHLPRGAQVQPLKNREIVINNTFNITTSKDMDEKELARRVNDQLSAMLRRKDSVWA